LEDFRPSIFDRFSDRFLRIWIWLALCMYIRVESSRWFKNNQAAPYAHHQNTCEVSIKLFKKSFMKLLHDSENPNGNTDWSLILPTITQAVNRQIVLSLGMTRESIHFNSPTEFYPLAHIAKEAQNDLQDVFNTFDRNFYQQLVDERLKRQSYLNRAKIPIYWEGQIVFLKNLEPSKESTILKLPYKGPLRVKTISPRNVTLIDLETGREVTSHYEFIKPLSIKEFRLLLSKGWDLHINNERRIRNLGSIPILDVPFGLSSRDQVLNEELDLDDEIAPPQPLYPLENDSDSDDDDDDENPISSLFRESSDKSKRPHVEYPSDDPRFDPHEGTSFGSMVLQNPPPFDPGVPASNPTPKNPFIIAPDFSSILSHSTLPPPFCRLVASLSEQSEAVDCNSLLNKAQPGLSGLENIAFFSPDVPYNSARDHLEYDNMFISLSPSTLPISQEASKDSSLIKGTKSAVSRDYGPQKTNLKNQKKVGFKSFLTRFFTHED